MTGGGTQRSEFFGIPATNKYARWMSAGIYKVEHGKIKERWIDVTRLPLLRQLGILPAVPLEVLPIIRPESLKG
ncbi:ester cyclase [Reticulibacter mediterranei]|uniref:ester cyclase n=1 Tax=Reticulibacter mediterranei TaxID=2778369 RepID=UPI001C68EF29